ncbi:LOW QUALITY PROTEIN: brefeldin A-inhibited guanine nucleotide-exchange protein 3-like [Rhipicephalus sanguineus]|uniref:LOW QUALITY PROTEIN: brefeldin A-inhibited guanine nucleotide-exchange protein 3-like n=1 Tax=Rhipicephalus sanguineus TaxID=34632 RepID=UPI0018949DC3|nr:LOW QUALITY PROTEIN: brefeldin A-inhibited guanine nucleotide-exchange protein 3-like [Rhipicephalus sanguineus]
MEDIFYKLVKEASHQKHPALRQACQEAQEALANKHALLRNPPYEVRQKCFDALQLALESKEKKLVSLSFSGLQQLLREQLFNPNLECDDEQLWLPSQLMRAISSLASQPEEAQVEGLKVILQCCCLQNWCLSQNAVFSIVTLCLNIYSHGSAGTKSAAVASASQSVQGYVSFLFESAAEDAADEEERKSVDEGCDPYNEGHISPFDEVVPLFLFLCEKLKEDKRNGSSSTAPLLLHCIQTGLSSLRGQARKSQPFLDFVWQQLCPRLVGCLGSPLKDKNIVSAQRFEKGEMGRGSGCLTTAPSYHAEEARLVYGIALELVTIVGEVGALRPVLGSLFHRMLLYPLPQHCLEPLKFVKQMLKNPEQLLQFAGPPLWEDTKNPRLSSLDLLKIVVDGLGECCHSNEPSVCYISVECVVALLSSLETLVSGSRISDQMAERLNATFPTLQCADYVGASFLFEKSARGAFRNGWQATDIKSGENGTPPVTEGAQVVHQTSIIQCSDVHLEDIHDSPKHSLVEEALEASEVQCDAEPPEQASVTHEGVDEQKEGHLDPESCVPELESREAREHGEVALEEGSLPDEELQSGSYMEYSLGDEASEFADESLYDTDLAEKPLEEETDISPEARTSAMERAAKTLMKDANESERNRLEKFFESNNEFAERERKTARDFVDHLASFLPRLLHIRSSIEADQELQQFASDYAETLWQQQQQQHSGTELEGTPQHITIVNADGIYLATYSALLLDLKLIHSGYRKRLTGDVPLTEEKFVDEVHGSGVLVYLSATWLSELYQQVLARSLLREAGYEPESKMNLALINLLTDVDGLGSDQLGSRQLSDYRRLERAATNVVFTPHMLAGMKFARHVLTACWDTMLEVLSVLLNGTNSCGIASSLGLLLGTDGAKEDHRKAREAVANCLDGLQCAAKLCNVLGLQTKCGAIFAQLAAASCPALDSNGAVAGQARRKTSKRDRLRKTMLSSRSKSVRLHASHVLSMDVLLSRGLELGSHSAVCWKHVFRCCSYILELEQSCFHVKPTSSSPSGSSHLKLQLSSFSWGEKVQQALSPKAQPSSDCLLLQPPSEHFEEEMAVEALSMPGVGHAGSANVVDLVKNATQASGSSVLMGKQLQPIIEALSQLVDRLFDEAAGKLNLCALVDFLSELCAASRNQLFNRGTPLTARHSVLLLNRLSEVMLRCSRGGRPLVHIMKAWSVVAPHFVEVACHKDNVIAKRAVTSIHDIVGALLSTHIDLPHFHFNEALFKPFENILCLELCDVDIQEQIVSCICEFVEGSTAEIRSGWRPLFGALRAVRMPCAVAGPHTQRGSSASSAVSEREQLERTHHLRVVLDVFDAFLGTDNPSVFANAAVDCLLCLLKHVRGPAELQDQAEPEACLAQDVEVIPLNLCQAALRYLERCAQMLSSMYLMPACPVFHSARRIKFNSEPNCVDPVLPNMELILFKELDSVSQHSDNENANDEGASKAWYVQSEIAEEPVPASVDQTVSLEELDRPTGVLHVWFLLLEGLAGAVATCPRRYQPHTIDTLFQMLRGLREVPGPEFGVYAVNHLLLPMLQGWLRRASKTYRGWDGFANNFKQCCGLATELVVEYLGELSASGALTQVRGLMLMVHQLFLVLAECIAQPVEVVSRLGCACIRHLLVSGGPSLSPDLWRVAACSVWRATRATLLAAQQLMVCFHAGSENFYGDVGQAKVAVRRDCTRQEADRLRQLCRQVFLLDAQRATLNVASCRVESAPTAVDQECSFIFLLHPPDKDPVPATAAHPSSYVVRVPFQQLVVGLLSHQILLQTLATLLLESTRFRLPALASVLACPASPARSKQQPGQYRLAGQLEVIPMEQLRSLLSVLEESYSTATDFDERPGLKFLVQKVARCEVAANLFKQAAISWAIQAVVLLELCLGRPAAQPLTMDAVNRLVASAGSPAGDARRDGEEGSDDGCENEDDEGDEERARKVDEEGLRQAKDKAKDEVEDSKGEDGKGEEKVDVVENEDQKEEPKCEQATKVGADDDGSVREEVDVSEEAAVEDESEAKSTQDETVRKEPLMDTGAGDSVTQGEERGEHDGAQINGNHGEKGENVECGKKEERVENLEDRGERSRKDGDTSSSSSEDGEDESKAPIDSFEEDKCQWKKRRRRRFRREQRISEFLSVRRAKSSLNEASGEDWNPYRRLRSLFADLCAHYARVASPEAKEGAILDRVSDQPIFFLMAQPDTLPEILPDRRISRADSAGSAAGSELAARHPVPLLATDSSSDSSEPEMAAASESALQPDRVYSIVTERAIQSMVSEYKRRKTRHSMPATVPVAPPSTATLRRQRSSVSSVASKKSSLSKGASIGSDEGAAAADNAGTSPPPLPTEVENQRRSSILKDAEAHVQVWSQLAQSVLELHLSLCEAEFLALVPVFYAGVEVLINCGPAEPELRALTTDWLHRVALGLGFSGSLVSSSTLQRRL